jgi:hypothetical protein
LATQKSKQNVYCLTHECPYLEYHLIKWLHQEHLADSSCAACPSIMILSEVQCASLMQADPKTLKTVKDVMSLLQESDDWDVEWSTKPFDVIMKFEADYACVMGQLEVQQRVK